MNTGSGQRFDAELRAALRELPHGAPPLDFAHAVATAAGTPARGGARWWLLAPALAFVAAALFAAGQYGGAWAAGFALLSQVLGGARSLDWIAAAGACLALSWALARLRPPAAR